MEHSILPEHGAQRTQLLKQSVPIAVDMQDSDFDLSLTAHLHFLRCRRLPTTVNTVAGRDS